MQEYIFGVVKQETEDKLGINYIVGEIIEGNTQEVEYVDGCLEMRGVPLFSIHEICISADGCKYVNEINPFDFMESRDEDSTEEDKKAELALDILREEK